MALWQKVKSMFAPELNDVQITARVLQGGRCYYCKSPVSQDIISEKSVVYVCVNTGCGHKYEIMGMEDENGNS